jgi:uncharacterized membrane protein YkvA (DUF1232 family)
MGDKSQKFISKLKEQAKILKKNLTLISKAAKDPRVPLYAKVIAGATLLYALSPIDLIPDWIPILGLVDDIIIVPLGIYISLKAIPQEVLDELKEEQKMSD